MSFNLSELSSPNLVRKVGEPACLMRQVDAPNEW